MYVCNCKGINEKQIKKLVKEKGLTSVSQLKKFSELGLDCGKCIKHAKRVIDACKKSL